MLWEAIFMLIVLKIPVVYLCAVVWWAIKAEPTPPDGEAGVVVSLEPRPPCDWRLRNVRALGRGPAPRPPRRGRRPVRTTYARAQVTL